MVKEGQKADSTYQAQRKAFPLIKRSVATVASWSFTVQTKNLLHWNVNQVLSGRNEVKETNFLGVILDEKLNWKSEISHVAKSIGIISRCSFFLPNSSLRMLYYPLIYPYFYYCNIVWASTYKTNLRRLVILQKRIIRIINKSHFNAHTDPIFKDLGILKFNDIHLLQLGQFMYSCKNSFLPPKFNNNFSQSNQFHSYNTRNSQAYRLPYCRTNTKKFSPFFQGPKFFNSLDNKVINSQSLSSFKKKRKIKLLSKYENSSQCLSIFDFSPSFLQLM